MALTERLPLHAAVIAAVFLAIYLPAVGKGFIKDDIGWIAESRVESLSGVTTLFERSAGFYRPLVALTFAANERLSGMQPFGYGLTNLLLAVLCALAVWSFARALGLVPGASLIAAAAWLLNFHGINMAILWISGRTALLLVLWAVLAGIAVTRGHLVAGATLAFAAMLSKEEAVLLPLPLLALVWMTTDRKTRTASTVRLAGLLGGALALYALLRTRTSAMTPWTAPPHYAFVSDPIALLRNILEYADRAVTFPLVLTFCAWLFLRTRPRLLERERMTVRLGAIWLVAGFALTVLVPSRSSLYACFPGVGAALAAAGVISAVWRDLDQRARRSALAVALVLPMLMLPVHLARNARWVELAVLSESVLGDVGGVLPSMRPQQPLVVLDDRAQRANIASALGGFLRLAVELREGHAPEVWISPPMPDAPAEPVRAAPADSATVLALRQGRLEPASLPASAVYARLD